MLPEPDVIDLIRQARLGDERASDELARLIEPFIQRVVRTRMGKRGRRGVIDREFGSSDVCQSVFRSLFRGLRKNRFQFDKPADLERLLHKMIRFNVATKSRRSSIRLRELIADFNAEEWIDSAPSPVDAAGEQDLVDAIQAQFTEEKLEMLTLWLDDKPWAEIGPRLGCSADAARVRLKRAVARVREKMSGRNENGA